MEKLSDSPYREQIEKLKGNSNFEKEGDRLFLEHPDREARLLWAFHRPSGSHPRQIEDRDILVSAMAFNHSRLSPYERIKRVHKDLLTCEHIIKINNRMRMLFRALTDDDFKELVQILTEFPYLKPFAINQTINGRRILEINADIEALTSFMEMVNLDNKKLLESLFARVGAIEDMEKEELKEFIKDLKGKKVHLLLVEYIEKEIEKYSDKYSLHILQRKTLQKLLKESLGG